jgi:hypothetical protein
VYYITADVQAVVEQLKEITARAELESVARLAAFVSRLYNLDRSKLIESRRKRWMNA